MPPKPPSLVQDDLAAMISPIPMGRRFTLDIAEEATARLGREGVRYAFEDLCKKIARQHQPDIEREIRAYLSAPENREWFKEVIVSATFTVIREFMSYMKDDEEEWSPPTPGTDK